MSEERSALYSEFQTDASAELEGVWVRNIGPEFHVKVARWLNRKHRELLRRLTKPFQQQIDRETMPDDQADEIAIRAMAETVVMDWEGKGATDEDGKPLAPTMENKIKLLTDLPDLRAAIQVAAAVQDQYRSASIEEAEKNSERSSAGSLGGEDSPTQSEPSTSAE